MVRQPPTDPSTRDRHLPMDGRGRAFLRFRCRGADTAELLGRVRDEGQAAHDVLERCDPTLQLLDDVLLLVGHTMAAWRRDPATVIATVTATMMAISGIHPSSVAGTTICRKYITKSNSPIATPRSRVNCSVRPSRASRLPVASASAPWAAAIPTAATAPLKSVSMMADRPGL